MLLGKLHFSVDDDVVTLDAHHLARILVDEILHPARQNARGQLAAHGLLQVGLGHLHLVGQIEDLQNLLVGLESDGAQQRGYRQLLLTVDVGVHHVVDVRRELDPRSLERDDTRRVELRAVGVHALAEEYARRAVQLRNDHALGAVEYERTAVGHVGDGAEIDILHHHTEILVLVVRAVEFQFGLEGYAVSQTALQTLLNRVAGRVDIVVDELQYEVVTCVGNGKILLKHLVEALVLTILGRGVHLEKISE